MTDKPWKLYVYDKSSDIDRDQADGRFDGATDVLTFGIEKGVSELYDVLGNLVDMGWTFDRALFQTHGTPGGILFGGHMFGALSMKAHCAPFAKLFPGPARIYFDGCNVAEGGDGTDFLIAAGETLLNLAGGLTIGWTTLGHGMPGWMPFIGGHTLHFGDDDTIKAIRFQPGGEPDFAHSWIP